MDTELLAELELARWDWSRLRQATGPATHVPGSIRGMLRSTTPDELDEHYWELENHVVIQGRLFQAAPPVVSVVMAALTCSTRPSWVRIGLLDLLFQLVIGTSHENEIANGSHLLGATCKKAARHGIWVLYRELIEGERDAARDILDQVEEDRDRLSAVLARLSS
jgi:hypothetical protein